jgi:uncharacterized membrane protein
VTKKIADKESDVVIPEPITQLEKVIEKEVPSLTAIPEKDRSVLIHAILSKVSVTEYSGPFMPPDILKECEKIVPGSAKKIIDMALKDSEHQRIIEDKIVSRKLNQISAGQWFAFIIACLALIAATVAALFGQTSFAITLITIDLVGLVSVFMYGTYRGRAENKEDES